jgi:hypothetical protein
MRDETGMTEDAFAGSIERAGADRLEGWCWCPDRPDERVTVEILLDDEKVAELVANLFRRDLARAGLGDGRHAFVLHADGRALDRERLDEAGLIGLRERSSGRIVGRLRQRPAGEARREHLQLARLQAELGPILLAAASSPPAPPAACLRAAFASLGDLLAARADDPFGEGPAPSGPAADTLGMAARGLARRLDPVDLPILAAPAVTLVLPAYDDVERTWALLAALAPHMAVMGADIVLVDDGSDPHTALLPTLIPNLTLVRATGGFAAAGNAACPAARGGMIALLDLGDTSPRLFAAGLQAALGTAAGEVMLGERTLDAAMGLGVLERLAPEELADRTAGGIMDPDEPAAQDPALLLRIPRDLYREAGGLDPMLSGDESLCALDLALRAGLLGHRVVAAAATWPRRRSSGRPIAEHLAVRFAARWHGTPPLDASRTPP